MKKNYLILMFSAVVLSACDSNSTDSEDRPVPVQVQVEGASLVLATATEFSNLGTGLPVAVGSLVDYDIVFLVEDPDASSPVPYIPGSDEYLEVSIENTAVARWETDAAGSFSAGLRGVSEGSTSIVFRLKRGTVGTAGAVTVFQAFPIPITVSL